MERCTNHYDIEAVGQCCTCGAMLCAECVAPGMESLTCFKCAIDGAGKMAGAEVGKAVPYRAAAAHKRRGLSRATVGIVIVGALLMAIEAWLILGGGELVSSPAVEAQARTKAVNSVTVCDGARMDAYFSEHGTYPIELEVVTAGLPEDLRLQILREGVVLGDTGEMPVSESISSGHGSDDSTISTGRDTEGGQ